MYRSIGIIYVSIILIVISSNFPILIQSHNIAPTFKTWTCTRTYRILMYQMDHDAFKCIISNVKFEPEEDHCGPVSLQNNGLVLPSIHTYDIVVNNSTVKCIPQGFLSKKISKFVCVKCELNRLEVSDFENAKSLEIFNVSQNEIDHLKANTFRNAKSLQKLDLSYNKIDYIPSNVFQGLINLTSIDFSNNRIVNLMPGTFVGLNSLEQLRLNNNKIIDGIACFTFNNSSKLQLLDMSNNMLESISGDFLSNCIPRMQYLDISRNRLKDFRIAESSRHMTALNLSNNSLQILNITFKVSTIDISRNSIYQLDIKYPEELLTLQMASNFLNNFESIIKMVNLQNLDISYNNIKIFDTHILKSLPKLNVLNLANTNLSVINYNTFSMNGELKILDISYNELGSINFLQLTNLNKLQELYIEGNNLTQITALDDFDILFPNLRLIGIAENLFTCQYLRKAVKILSKIYVTVYIENSIIVRNDSNFRGMACQDDTIVSRDRSNSSNWFTFKSFIHHIDHHLGDNVESSTSETNAAKQVDNKLNFTKQLNMQIEILQNDSIKFSYFMEFVKHDIKNDISVIKCLLIFICVLLLIYVAIHVLKIYFLRMSIPTVRYVTNSESI